MRVQETDKLLTQKEVAEILRVSESTLEQWRLKGRGPKFIKLGRAVRYPLSCVTEYLSELQRFSSTTEADAAKGEGYER